MGWSKEKPIKGGHGGCTCCGYQHDILPMDSIIAVGFGEATLRKNNTMVYSEPYENTEFMTVKEAEELAKQDPDNDWRIHLVAPLSERHYQRQDDNHWVLYEKGEGFA